MCIYSKNNKLVIFYLIIFILFFININTSYSAQNYTKIYDIGDYSTQGHLVYEKGNGVPSNPNNYDNSASSSDYTSIDTSDNSYFITALADANNEYDSQIYHFQLDDDLGKIYHINYTWEGHSSEIRSNYDMASYIWNSNTNSWENFGYDGNGNTNDVVWRDSITTNFDNYIDSNDKTYFYSRFQLYVSSSCPFIYSYNGSNYIIEHESFPFSVIKTMQSTTYDRIKNLKNENNKYNLQIREELNEISYIDYFKLYKIKHPDNKSFVMPDTNGKFHTIKKLEAPVACFKNNVFSCLNEIKYKDDSYLEDTYKNINFSNQDKYKDTSINNFDLYFNKPKQAQSAKLFFDIQKKQIVTDIWEFYIKKIGFNWWKLWENFLYKTFLGDMLENVFENFPNMKVEVYDGNKWIEVEQIQAGLHIEDDFLIEINLSNIKTDYLKVRFRSTKGFFKINYIGIDFSKNEEMVIEELDPNEVYFNNKSKNEFLKKINDKDEKYFQLENGDIVNLVYNADNNVTSNKYKDWKTDFTVEINGYYNSITENKTFFSFLKGGLTWSKLILNPKGIFPYFYENNKNEEEFNNNNFKHKKSHNSLYTDYVNVRILYEVDLSINQTSFNFSNVIQNNTYLKNFTLNSIGNNSNTQIYNISGNGSDFITADLSSTNDMLHNTIQNITFNCSPTYNVNPGYYEVTFKINSTKDPSGEDVIIGCDVIDTIDPIVLNVTPNGDVFECNNSIDINVNVTDDVGVNLVYANVSWNNSNNNYILELTDSDSDNIFDEIFTNTTYLGIYNFSIFANDTSGNINNTEESYFIVEDTISPLLFIESPLNNYKYNYSNILINFTAKDIHLDKLWYFNGTNNISYTLPQTLNLNDGEYNFSFYANDSSNNINSSTISFEIDTQEPIVDVYSPESKIYEGTRDILINFTATDKNLDKMWFSNGTNNISYISPFYLTLPYGSYSFRFYANDTFGNIEYDIVNFELLMKTNNISLSKQIISINKDQYLINLRVNNSLNKVNNATLLDFVNHKFNYGSFSSNYNDSMVISGNKYNGTIFKWFLSIPANTIYEINYSIVGIKNYFLNKNYIFGIE